jgi:autotransporter-associated beta strand protein
MFRVFGHQDVAVLDGGINKTGSTVLQLTSSGNTYAGGTTITAGTIRTSTTTTADSGTGVLGVGNVIVKNVASGSPATLELDSNNAINDLATLQLDAGTSAALNGKAFLNFTGNEIVSGLILGGVSQPDGIYNAANQPNYFTGTGNIQVVPEPATLGMTAAGGLGLLLRRRRRMG